MPSDDPPIVCHLGRAPRRRAGGGLTRRLRRRSRSAAGRTELLRSMASAGGPLDAVIRGLNDFRLSRNNGLSEVTVEPARRSSRGASARHGGTRQARSRRHSWVCRTHQGSGYDAKVAVENIGTGYHTLAERSPAGVTRRRIARLAAQGRQPPRHRRGVRAAFEIQGVLVADPCRAGRRAAQLIAPAVF